jgi:hypothetical protein
MAARTFRLFFAAVVVAVGLVAAPLAAAADPYGYPPPCSGYTCPPPQVCDQFVGTVCVNPGPVEGSYDPNQAGPTMLTGPFTAGEVIVFPHSIPVPGTVRLDENPPDPAHLGLPRGGKSQTFSVLSAWFDVTFAASQGVFDPTGPWDPPVQVIFPLPASAATLATSAIAVFSHATAWQRIPNVSPATTLTATQRDGFFLTGSGASRFVHVLTRHLTVFAAFKVTIVKPPKPHLVAFAKVRPCSASVTLGLRVQRPRSNAITRAMVWVNGRPARILEGDALRQRVRLHHLPRGRLTVRVKLHVAGAIVAVTRTYPSC